MHGWRALQTTTTALANALSAHLPSMPAPELLLLLRLLADDGPRSVHRMAGQLCEERRCCDAVRCRRGSVPLSQSVRKRASQSTAGSWTAPPTAPSGRRPQLSAMRGGIADDASHSSLLADVRPQPRRVAHGRQPRRCATQAHLLSCSRSGLCAHSMRCADYRLSLRRQERRHDQWAVAQAERDKRPGCAGDSSSPAAGDAGIICTLSTAERCSLSTTADVREATVIAKTPTKERNGRAGLHLNQSLHVSDDLAFPSAG